MTGAVPAVAVLGNGPVGQTAALMLARWGLPVVLLDQRPRRDLTGSKSIVQQRDVLDAWEAVGAVRDRGGTLKDAFQRTHAALVDRYGGWPIFEHCLPFNVSRLWDELSGVERPRIWTAERDREVWDALQD